MTLRLLVIITNRLSALATKGELIERYYNPGNIFDEVHIVMTNNDQVDPAVIQPAAGRARLFIYNLPAPTARQSAGWQKPLIEGWVQQGLALARTISPDLIKVHNNFIQGYLAYRIKQALGTPYVVSLHGVWDKDDQIGFRNRALAFFRKKFERQCLENADAVVAVYSPILRYARAYGAKNLHLIYNFVAGDKIQVKADYSLHAPPRLLTINRQVKEKNPENILRAIQTIDCQYDIIGRGELHEYLQAVAQEAGVSHKVRFIEALPNEQVCNSLKDYDLMVSHCDYWGTSKTVIEAGLAGLPVLLNHHPVEPIPEYTSGWIALCNNTPEDYRQAILGLLERQELRQQYGQKALAFARQNFAPEEMERKLAGVYRQALGQSD